MTTKAIITQRGIPRMEAVEDESSEAQDLGLTVEYHLPQGTLVSGDEEQFVQAEERGYRVKLLRYTNILEVGSYRIDIEADPPTVPTRLEVPKRLEVLIIAPEGHSIASGRRATQPRRAGDGLQLSLRFSFQPRLTPGVWLQTADYLGVNKRIIFCRNIKRYWISRRICRSISCSASMKGVFPCQKRYS